MKRTNNKKFYIRVKKPKNKRQFNIGLLFIIIFVSVTTWFLTEYIVYKLNEKNLVAIEWVGKSRPEAWAHTTDLPANPNASAKTKAVLSYIQSLSGKTTKKVISGQERTSEAKKVHDIVGYWPGLIAEDYYGSPWDKPYPDNSNPDLINAWNAGSLVGVHMHAANPENGKAFYESGAANITLANVYTPGTTAYNTWTQHMDIIAAGFQELQDAGVVVLFRPFHEMCSTWWWGAHWNTGGDIPRVEFVNLWKRLFDYLTYTKKLNNLLWVYTPSGGINCLNKYYPGDRYVDIVGNDYYGTNPKWQESTQDQFIAATGKPFAFTEFGPKSFGSQLSPFDYMVFLDALKNNLTNTVYWLSWGTVESLYYDLYSNANLLLSDPIIINRGDLPNFNAGTCTDNDSDGYDTCSPGQTGDDGKALDCNDSNSTIHPGANEICDSLDNNCNNTVDEGCSLYCGDGTCNGAENCLDCTADCGLCSGKCTDSDGDGYGTCPDCGTSKGCIHNGDDCNDSDNAIHPGINDVCGDGIDNDCDGIADENCGYPSTKCYDGTALNKCLDANPIYAKSQAPWYCNNVAQMVENCGLCGCRNGWLCSSSGQTSCTAPSVNNYCGDGICGSGESCFNCQTDCGDCFPTKTCIGGTPFGACTGTGGMYCNPSGVLVEDCTKCSYCYNGWTCNSANKKCEESQGLSTNICSDGTPIDTCTGTGGMYCNANKVLVEDCVACANCYGGWTCNASTKKCESSPIIPGECTRDRVKIVNNNLVASNGAILRGENPWFGSSDRNNPNYWINLRDNFNMNAVRVLIYKEPQNPGNGWYTTITTQAERDDCTNACWKEIRFVSGLEKCWNKTCGWTCGCSGWFSHCNDNCSINNFKTDASIRDFDFDDSGDISASEKQQWLQFTANKVFPVLDQWVDMAAQYGFYVIIDYHPVGGHDPEDALAWWAEVAPRYKDRKHVIYELINEPSFGFTDNYNNSKNPGLIDLEKDLYQVVRSLAPNTHIILWSFAHVHGDALTSVQSGAGINYANASVGFHIYSFQSTNVDNLQTNYPVMQTEIGGNNTGEYNTGIGYMEARNLSWITQDGTLKSPPINVTWGKDPCF